MFSIYCLIYAYKTMFRPSQGAGKNGHVSRDASWPLMFPVIIVGGIYGGIVSPTEAAAVCVLYALLLEFVIFRSLKSIDIYRIAKSTGLITAVVFILVAVGNGFSWIISFAQIPQSILEAVGVNDAGPVGVLIAICGLLHRLYVRRPIVVILVLTPIFAPPFRPPGWIRCLSVC